MKSTILASGAIALTAFAFGACSGSSVSSGFEPNGGGGGGADGGSGGGGSDASDDIGSIGHVSDSGSTATCNPNPANYDIPGNHCDDDGDGQVDNVVTCDAALAAGGDAMAFAKSIGLCQQAGGGKWGIVSAAFTNSHAGTSPPNAEQHGILSKFGNVVKPREGTMFGILSSGSATENDTDTGPFFKGQKNGMQPLSLGGGAPPGYPRTSPGCPSLGAGTNDLIDVKLVIKAPANAKGLQFDFDFYSGEWPEYVCTPYNDAFIAYLTAQGFNGGASDNMVFDANNNPVSVNNGFFDRCTPNTQTGCAQGIGGTTKTATCPGGIAELAGTGFDDPGTYCTKPSSGGGATGWLQSKAPIKPGEQFTLEFMIWDTGDSSWDSSVIVDNFQWAPGDTTTGTQRPPK